MELTRSSTSLVGNILVALAVGIFLTGLVVFAGGNEVALLPMMFALGVFTTGIGVLAVARRA